MALTPWYGMDSNSLDPWSGGFDTLDPWMSGSTPFGVSPFMDQSLMDPMMGGFRRKMWGLGPLSDQRMMNPMMMGGPAAREVRRDLRPYAPILTTELIEGPSDYHIHIDLPGAENLSTEIVGRTLVIKAEKKVVHDEDQDLVRSSERAYGSMRRSMLIPLDANIDNVTSSYRNGVLHVSFPKVGDARPSKKVPIEL